MIDLICMWLGSIVINLYIKEYNKCYLCKYIAECGYKVNLRKLEELEDLNIYDYESIKKISLSLEDFTFLNGMLKNFKEALSENDLKCLLKFLAKNDLLLKLTDEEKKAFFEDPSGKRAFLIFYQYYEKIKSSLFTYILDKGIIVGKIYYDICITDDNITILETEGLANKMTLEEQVSKVKQLQNERLEFTKSFIRKRINDINQ